MLRTLVLSGSGPEQLVHSLGVLEVDAPGPLTQVRAMEHGEAPLSLCVVQHVVHSVEKFPWDSVCVLQGQVPR